MTVTVTVTVTIDGQSVPFFFFFCCLLFVWQAVWPYRSKENDGSLRRNLTGVAVAGSLGGASVA